MIIKPQIKILLDPKTHKVPEIYKENKYIIVFDSERKMYQLILKETNNLIYENKSKSEVEKYFKDLVC